MTQDNSETLQIRNLSDLLCFSIYTTGHAFTRVYKPVLDELGLTYPQYLVLVSLWEQDGQTVGGLGKMLHLESNTLTPLLKRLEALGLVDRRRDSQDERQVRIVLTDEGKAMRKNAARVPDCIKQATGMDVSDLRKLQKDVEALRERLDQFTQQD